MNKKILVLGGSGKIGTQKMKYLSKNADFKYYKNFISGGKSFD